MQVCARFSGCSDEWIVSTVQVFTEMVFVFGYVHCDPHAANMMVQRGRKGHPILVLLDHGLYQYALTCSARGCGNVPGCSWLLATSTISLSQHACNSVTLAVVSDTCSFIALCGITFNMRLHGCVQANQRQL